MTLKEFFDSQPRGARAEMARSLGITRTWLSLIVHGHKKASPILSAMIQKLTKKQVSKESLRPDIFS